MGGRGGGRGALSITSIVHSNFQTSVWNIIIIRAPVQWKVLPGHLCNGIYCPGICAKEYIIGACVQWNIIISSGHLYSGIYRQGTRAMEYIARAPVQWNISPGHLCNILTGHLCTGIYHQGTWATEYTVRAPVHWNIYHQGTCALEYISPGHLYHLPASQQ